MITRNDLAADAIYASGMPTSHMIALALTAPTVDGRSELYGRSHAFYSIASDVVSATEFILSEDDQGKRRRYASRALGAAGYDLSGLYELAANAGPRSVAGRHVDS